MSAIEPAGEKIVRNLQQAVERLHDDIARVELWADALGCFSKPVPDYDPAKGNLNKFALTPTRSGKQAATPPRRHSESSCNEAERAGLTRSDRGAKINGDPD